MQVDEPLRTQQLIDGVFAARVASHQPLERRGLVMAEVVDVHVGIGRPARHDAIDDGLERRALLAIIKRPTRGVVEAASSAASAIARSGGNASAVARS